MTKGQQLLVVVGNFFPSLQPNQNPYSLLCHHHPQIPNRRPPQLYLSPERGADKNGVISMVQTDSVLPTPEFLGSR